MTFFRKAKAGSCPGVDSSIPSNRGGKKNLDLRHRSESTFVMGEEWDSGETIGDDNSSSRSVGHSDGDLEEFQNTNMNHDEKMTQVLEGTSLSIPSIPPSSTVSVGSSSVDTQEEVEDYDTCLPPPLNASKWSEVSPMDYPVRSAGYLKTGHKQASDESVMTLFAVDLVQTETPTCMCGHPEERLQQSLRRGDAPEFCFAVNICLPAPTKGGGGGTKGKGAFYQFVAYFGTHDRARLFDQNTPVGRLAREFCFGDSRSNDATFKLIPKIVDGGGFVFRQAVGSKPVLLGKKVSQRYYRCEDYCEVLIDIASDPIAKRIVRMALGLSTHLTVDLSFCLEGKTEETLPEALLGGVRVQGINFAQDGQRFVENHSVMDS